MGIKHSCRSFMGILVVMSFMSPRADACSEIYFEKGAAYRISARNFDFMSGDGFVRFSPRGVARQSQYAPPDCLPLKWESRYSSITFNTVLAKSAEPEDGAYYAGVDGINQAGFKVGTYFLGSSKFPVDGPMTAVDICSLTDYLLDNFQNVNEAVADLRSGMYRVVSTPTGVLEITLQLLVHDASGTSAVVAFLDGSISIIMNPETPVLTNNPYLESVEHLKLFTGFGGTQAIPGTNQSLDRFVRAAFYRSHLELPDDRALAVNYGFSVAQTVSVSPKIDGIATQWSIVSDIESRRVSYRTLSHPNIVSINLNRLADTVKTPAKVDLSRTDLQGDITEMFLK